MGAALNAPLAAILAVIELTHTVSIGMPAMLAIVAACLTNTVMFRQQSAHQTVLRQLMRVVPEDPLNQLLHRTDVSSAMDSRVMRVPTHLPGATAGVHAHLVPAGAGGRGSLPGTGRGPAGLAESEGFGSGARTRAGAGDGPRTGTGQRRGQAMDTMYAQTVEAACVYERSRSTGKRILHGVLTRESVEKFTLSRL
jgi:hypothetical protein